MAKPHDHPSDPPAEPPEPRVTAGEVAAPRAHPAGRVQGTHLYRAAGLLFLLAVVFKFFDSIAHVLLLGYAAAIVAVGLNALARHLPLRRKWVAVLTGLAVIGTGAGLLWLATPLLLEQGRNLAGMLPGLQEQVRAWEQWIREQTGLQVKIPFPGSGGGGMPSGAAQGLLTGAGRVLQAVLFPLVVFVGALFAMASPNQRLLTPLLRAFPHDLRLAWYRIFQLLGERLLGWMKGTGTAMLGVGILSITAFSLIGVPSALLLGLFNGLVEFIPIFGPLLGGLTAVAIAFLDDPTKALWTAAAALAIQQVEANVITPWAMAKNAEIHPFITLFALVLFGQIFGFLGLLLALPLVLLTWTLVQVLWVERAIDTDREHVAPLVRE
jgi:predicted PurR-regulated permease PerM